WNVEQSIRQRVAALPPTAQELLGAAAVAGRVVSGALLLALAEHPEQEVLSALKTAQHARLFVETAGGAYTFAHDLVRQGVEAELSARECTAWHRRIALVLEAAPGEPDVEVLAYHFARSDEVEKALHYLERAGDHAQGQYAHARAEQHFAQLVEQLERLGRRMEAARVREKLSAVLNLTGRYAAQLEVLAQATAAYRAAGHRCGQARTLLAAAHAHVRAQAPQEALAGPRPLQEEPFTSALAPPEHVPLHAWLSQALPRPSEALRAAEQALTLAQAMGAEDLVTHARNGHGFVLLRLARLNDALASYEGMRTVA